jgi:hypothetical protein
MGKPLVGEVVLPFPQTALQNEKIVKADIGRQLASLIHNPRRLSKQDDNRARRSLCENGDLDVSCLSGCYSTDPYVAHML